MPRYTVQVVIFENEFDPEQQMAMETTASDAAGAEAEAITYFEADGDGPLTGLTRGTDYTATATPFGARPT